LANIWNEEIRKRFWNKVDIRNPDECWIWKDSKTRGGYGEFRISTERKMPAHRFSYATVYGITDISHDIHHTCRNPSCVNFHHLEEVSHKNNIRQQTRVLDTHCINGHKRTKENTYYYENGKRRCRVCRREQQNRRANAISE
jgi:hypothetical protein